MIELNNLESVPPPSHNACCHPHTAVPDQCLIQSSGKFKTLFMLHTTLFQISVNTTRQRRLVQHLGETLLLQ